jgi:hypothetical protein
MRTCAIPNRATPNRAILNRAILNRAILNRAILNRVILDRAVPDCAVPGRRPGLRRSRPPSRTAVPDRAVGPRHPGKRAGGEARFDLGRGALRGVSGSGSPRALFRILEIVYTAWRSAI